MSWGGVESRVGIKLRAQHPNRSDTPIGLRRVCGTCRHFTGPIRGDGECSALMALTHGLQRAMDCNEWSRPDPVAVLPPKAPSAPHEPKERKTYEPAKRTATEERIEAIRACAAAGLSIAETARRLEIKKGSVAYVSEYYTVPFPGKGGCQETHRRNNKIRAALAEGKAIADIAAEHGVTRNTVYKIKARMS